MRLILRPVSNYNQGLSEVDWEIHQLAHTRHQSNLNQKRAAIQLSSKEKVQFECTKADVASMLEKIDACL